MDVRLFKRFQTVLVLCGMGLVGMLECAAHAPDLASLAQHPLGTGEAFRPVSEASLNSAASKLRGAIGPLEKLLGRSPSGADWKRYLDWPSLTAQASPGKKADPAILRRLQSLFESGSNGLDMHQFVAVRRAVAAYAEAADAAQSPAAQAVYAQRIEKLAAAVAAGAATGTTEPLEPVGGLLAKLEESAQAPATVARVRSVFSRPNLFLDVDENLLGAAVNRMIDQSASVNETVLGTRIRGMGHTKGLVLLDVVPSNDRAIVDITFNATNHSTTAGTKGPVTVCTSGITQLNARKRIIVDDQRVSSLPVEAHASARTSTTGMSIASRFGTRFIEKMATRKIAEMRPQAEAIAGQKARDRVRSQFEEQTSGAIAKAASDYQTKFRRPLQERGWFPEMLQINTSDSRLSVVARKALSDQIAAFTAPPAVDPENVLSVRLHETLVGNATEIVLGGRTITQADVKKMSEERSGGGLHESLQSDPDQPDWSITFASRRPVEIDAENGRVKLTVRGSRYTSGEREFPAMDISVSYRIEPAVGTIRLVRDGDVQIYPPGFVPGGGEKLTVAQTSLRRILQKRFGKVFKEVLDIEPLELQGQLAVAGPLPMEQFVAQKDGWVALGWRKREQTTKREQTKKTGEIASNDLPGLFVHHVLKGTDAEGQ